MRYLFFDQEYANTFNNKGKICEFGYVIIDDKFTLLEENIFVINPNAQFDRYALKYILSRTKDEYLSSPPFAQFQHEIVNLFSQKEIKIIGHSTKTDYDYLRYNLKRNNFRPIKVKYYDIKHIFIFLENVGFSKLSRMLEYYQIEIKGDMHDAHTDAMATMLVCKKMCEKFNMTIDELLETKLTTNKEII